MKTTPYAKSRRPAFTLIELLVVIAIIAVLAGLLFPVMNRISVNRARSVAYTELHEIEAAIKAFQGKYHVYPPDNPNSVSVHPLYYELVGTVLNPTNAEYRTLDGKRTLAVAQVPLQTGVSSFLNSSTSAKGGDEGTKPETFLKEVKPAQLKGDILACSEGPVWYYNSSHPTNNPGSYDLWVDLILGGKTNRISNWSRQPQIF